MTQRSRAWFFLCAMSTAMATPAIAADVDSSIKVEAESAKVPVALAWDQGGKLLVALRDARSIAAIDPAGWKVVGRWKIDISPISMAFAGDRKTLLVGGLDGKVLVLNSEFQTIRTIPSPSGSTRVLPLPGTRVATSSPWDGAVRIWDWETGAEVKRHALPFAPGAMIRHTDGRLIVADAFGGRLSVLKPGDTEAPRTYELDGVNLHALAISGDGNELLIGHMFQFDSVSVTNTNIDWGLILSSKLSAVRLTDLELDPESTSQLPRRRLTLDGSVHGAADPAALVLSPDGTEIFVALSGAHQVIKSVRSDGRNKPHPGELLPLGHNQRLEVSEVGRSPVALSLDPTGRFVVTADSMSDSVTVLDRTSLSQIASIPFHDGKLAQSAAQRGEALFRDGRRSLDRWMTCASCHPSGHTTGLNFDTQGDGGYGAPKNTPSLLGVARTEPFTWVGTFPKLSDQIHQSFLNSLRGRRPEPEEVSDVVAYLETLTPPPSLNTPDEAKVREGEQLFRTRGCVECHRAPNFTVDGLRDVGLNDDAGGHNEFNPPSLRGLHWSAPYFHDGRSDTLEEVLAVHPDPEKPSLKSDEIQALIAYLRSL
ncbi:cytochrome c peroxidase [Singulisphaera sp. PoT]|uniref:cytochrome c peroxidase n=1 Tax=Singulisphaera sp. PoT TaxID=3411797 RepID=UPI003BF52C90